MGTEQDQASSFLEHDTHPLRTGRKDLVSGRNLCD